MNIKFLFAIVAWLLFPAATVFSQSPLTEHTFRLDDPTATPAADISELGWMSGFWSGEGLAGQVDESWSGPAAGTMVSTFRMYKHNQIEFTEFQEISQTDNGIILRVKHFDRNFVGWEEKDKFVSFRLIKLADKAAYFDGLTYKIDEQGQLRVYVAMKRKDGTFNEGSFVYKPAKVGAKSAEIESKKNDSIKLPDDPDTVILTYDAKGGYRMPTPVGFQPTPLVRVFASGRVVFGRNTPDTPELEFVLGKDELAKLLEFVVNEKRILDITTEGLKQQIEASGKAVLVADAPTDQFSINLPKAQHDVEMYGLLFLRSTYRNIEDVQSLAAIREKLMFLRSRAALGSQEDVDRLLAEMGQEFNKSFPDSDPLTLDDLKNANINKDGSVRAQFSRMDYQNDGQPKFMYSGFVEIKDEKIKLKISRSLVK